MATECQRMMDGTHVSIEEEIAGFIGVPVKGVWVKLTIFLKQNYDIPPEIIYDKKHGWDARYRKSGKTEGGLKTPK